MYGSKRNNGRNAIAANAEYVGKSKNVCYEIPCGVTGIVKHTGSKDSLRAIMQRLEHWNVVNLGRGAIASYEALKRKTIP